MSIEPTREEWLAVRERMRAKAQDMRLNALPAELDGFAAAALDCPCPPEDPPEPLRKGAWTLVRIAERGLPQPLVCIPANPSYVLTADEADAMACSLVEHARYVREHEGPICGGLRRSTLSDPLCLRPKGHDGACDHRAQGAASDA